jgi:hypothetical protein
MDKHPRLRADSISGIRSGVSGAPPCFITGVRHDGGYGLESMLEPIRAAV